MAGKFLSFHTEFYSALRSSISWKASPGVVCFDIPQDHKIITEALNQAATTVDKSYVSKYLNYFS